LLDSFRKTASRQGASGLRLASSSLKMAPSRQVWAFFVGHLVETYRPPGTRGLHPAGRSAGSSATSYSPSEIPIES